MLIQNSWHPEINAPSMLQSHTLTPLGQLLVPLSICNLDIIWTKSKRWDSVHLLPWESDQKSLIEDVLFEFNLLKQNIVGSYESSNNEGHEHRKMVNFMFTSRKSEESYYCVAFINKIDQRGFPLELSCMILNVNDLDSIVKFGNNITSKSLKKKTKAKGNHAPTRREREVLNLLKLGKSQKEIASILKIKNSTVETHKTNLFAKYGVNSSIELVLRASN